MKTGDKVRVLSIKDTGPYAGAVGVIESESYDPYNWEVKFEDRQFPVAFKTSELELATGPVESELYIHIKLKPEEMKLAMNKGVPLEVRQAIVEGYVRYIRSELLGND